MHRQPLILELDGDNTTLQQHNALPALLQNSKWLFLLFLVVSVGCGLAVATRGASAGLLLAAGLVAVPSVLLIIAYPRIGICGMMVLAFVLMLLPRLGIRFPVGTIMDAWVLLLLFAFLLQQRQAPAWQLYRNPIAVLLLVWIGYNILQVVNPAAASRLAWVYTVRTVAIITVLYFIFLYFARSTRFVATLLMVWLSCSTVAAIYALKQEFLGFSAFEQSWLDADPVLTSLYFIGGSWRKFSFFADPVTFAYNMVISSSVCFALATGPVAPIKRLGLVALGLFQLAAMLYSGTRGAYVLVPLSVGMLMILKYNRWVLLSGVVAAAVLYLAIITPTTNPTIQRFQSAFWPQQDASYRVREANQERIRPYIRAHPFGGGLGATGTWGQRFAPESYLANFPPDSGYVRVAVELGWVGLLLFCTLMFIVLRTGIVNYYRIRDPRLKSWCLAMVLVVFVLHVGNFPQEALVQYPNNLLFYLAIALINVLPLLDAQQNKATVTPAKRTKPL